MGALRKEFVSTLETKFRRLTVTEPPSCPHSNSPQLHLGDQQQPWARPLRNETTVPITALITNGQSLSKVISKTVKSHSCQFCQHTEKPKKERLFYCHLHKLFVLFITYLPIKQQGSINMGWSPIFCPSTHLLFLDWQRSTCLCPQRTEMPGLLNRSQELCLLLLIHVKIFYIPLKPPDTLSSHKASAETSSQQRVPGTGTGASANNSSKSQPWHCPGAPLGSEPTDRRTQHHGRHSLHLMGRNELWGGMGFQKPWEGLVSALTDPTGAACISLQAPAKFPKSSMGKGGRSIGDSTNDTLIFSWKITWEED